MSFLRSPDRLSLSEFAKEHKVRSTDIWLPLHLAPTAHSRPDDPIMVADRTALALLDVAAKTLVYHRATIATALGLNNLDAAETPLYLERVPAGCEVFVRWDRPGRKMIPANTRVLHYALSPADALSQGVIAAPAVETRGRKRTRSDKTNSEDAASLAATDLRLKQRKADRAASQVDLARRLAALATPQTHHDMDQLRAATLSIIQSKRRLPPLHLFVSPTELLIPSNGDVVWQRPDPRVIYHTFRASGGATSRRPASRQLVLIFLDDVLLSLFRPTELLGAAQRSATVPSDEQLAARRAAIGGVVSQYVQRGYAVCFVDHFPSLHHAVESEFRRVTAAVEELCLANCAASDVAVVLSVLSNISASTGASASFALPQSAGLLHILTNEVNHSLPPDTSSSIVVGTLQRSAMFTRTHHQQFANHAGIPFVDIDAFLGLASAA